MTATPSEKSVIDAALSRVSRLATLPQTTTRILALLDDPNATATALEKLVSSDPILSAKVLKVVNSSFYGIPATVGSIKQAIMMLGLGGLKNIALAASLAKLFGGTQADSSFDPQGPWQHSAAVAAAAKLISDLVGADGDEMFLAGLLHDVGTVIALQAFRQEFIELVDHRKSDLGESYEIAEQRFLGATHEEFGLALCRSWNFPLTIQTAIEFHHKPTQCDTEFRRAAQIICVADHVAADCGIGYCSITDADEMPQEVVAELGLSADQLDNIRDLIPEAAQLADQIAA